MKAAIKNKVKRFIYMSSVDTVYGPDMTVTFYNEENKSGIKGKDVYT